MLFSIFSSEIRPILETGLVSKEVDNLGIHQYLTTQSTHYPNTIIKGIQMLNPGSFGVLEHEKSNLSIKKYWRMKIFNENNILVLFGDDKDYFEKLDNWINNFL